MGVLRKLPLLATLGRLRFGPRRQGGFYPIGVLTFVCVSRMTIANGESLLDPAGTLLKPISAEQPQAASMEPAEASRVYDGRSGPSNSSESGEYSLLYELENRLDQLERENASLAEQQSMLQEQIGVLNSQAAQAACPSSQASMYDHNRGMFVLVRGRDPSRFELRADFFTQARFASFARNADSWTDSTGAQFTTENFNSTEITRNFIQFTGSAIDPNLSFTTFIFSSTALNDTLFLGWLSYKFSDAIDVRIGNWQLPGTREWYQSFRYTLGTERLMATTFFRPNISPGIWAQGQVLENVRYVVMLANSTNRLAQGVTRLGNSRALSATAWWEPTGDFGAGPSDIEHHASPAWRLGSSMTYATEANQGFGDPALDNPEDTILRLSDGTPLFRPGALAPGVQIQSADYNLWAMDAAVKLRGVSLSGEYFFRLLNDFKTQPNALTIDSLFDHGGLLEGGVFFVPSVLEAFARTSFVTGQFGNGCEFGGGVNWYPNKSREFRFTAEALQIRNSPAQNLLTGYRAGESGTLFQLQCFADF